MNLLEYASKALLAWWLGFFPFLEIYVAVPVAVASGLDPFSSVFWPVFGNFAAVPLILFAKASLRRVKFFRRWLDREPSPRVDRWLHRYGLWVVLLLTPWIGVWAVAIAAAAAGMKKVPMMVATFVSITVYGMVTGWIAWNTIHFIESR